MTASGIPSNAKQLAALVKQGEGPALEFKRSTGELKEGMQTLCAFLNGSGGAVLFGVRPDGTIAGQEVSDQTLRDVAQAADRFEPPPHVSIHRIKVAPGRDVIAVTVEAGRDMRPFTHEGHAYERVSSTTRRMPQAKYERLLVERGHAKRRWENLSAEGLALKDLDRKEILRTRELAIQQNRISPDTSRDIGEILDRLKLRVDGDLTQAAQVLYGKEQLPYYTQCLLKMGRFRGTTVTGPIVDNRQEYIHAFAMVLEGMEFLRKTMPLGARFPKGEIFREDRFPVPLEALREILLNAVMHRDYSSASGYVAIAVFDDRIEISSYGRLPTGITVKQLSSEHRSYPVNPLIAGAFHRTGAVEIWGRGTNRVIAACKAHGAAPPVFHEQQGFVVVTFRAEMVAGIAPLQVTQHVSPQVEAQEAQVEAQEAQVSAQVGEEVGEQVTGEVTREVTREVAGEVTGEVRKLLGLCRGSMTRTELQAALSLRGEENFRKLYLVPALQAGLIEMTVPDKPRSRLQRYRATEAGLAMLRRKYKINHRDTERTEER